MSKLSAYAGPSDPTSTSAVRAASYVPPAEATTCFACIIDSVHDEIYLNIAW
jgi:hypothetical protein